MADTKTLDLARNHLLYGDCLEMLDWVPDGSVDLIYLDPPFKSDTDYNMLFGSETGEDTAQVKAFADTWYWKPDHKAVYTRLQLRGGAIGHMVESMHFMLGECGMLAYLLFMTERLIELQRVLKPTGSLYLHCDTTASHYLKLVLDAVFGIRMFRNEIVWKRATSHNDAKRFGRISDRILFYTKTDKFIWNGDAVRTPRTERELRSAFPSRDRRGYFRKADLTGPSHGQTSGESLKPWKGYDIASRGRVWSAPKRGSYADYIDRHIIPGYHQIEGIHDRLDKLDEHDMIVHPETGFWPSLKKYEASDLGNPIQDIILDPIGFTNYSVSNSEYLGYPTQKPLGLLEKLIRVSSNEGDVVLDPFCGCGTAVDAAEALGRRWIGMDVSVLAINVIRARLEDMHGGNVMTDVEVTGIPTSPEAARMLFLRDPFEFERWAVDLVGAEPNKKQVGDSGSDGELAFPSNDKKRAQRGVVSIKGGANINPSMVRDLRGTVEAMHAAMGVLVLMKPPTRGMITEAAKAGLWTDNFTDRSWPKLQIITVAELLDGKQLVMPTAHPPYTKAKYSHSDSRQGELL